MTAAASRWPVALLVLAAACARPLPPAVPSAPAFPDVPTLVVPASLAAETRAAERHDAGWRRFQSGDLRGAARDWQAALSAAPGFYPARTGLGYIALEERRWTEAAEAFDAALAVDAVYTPALAGRVEAALSADDAPAAALALERLIALTPPGAERDEREGRLDVLRLRAVQEVLARAAADREAGRYEAALAALAQARTLAPGSPTVLRELARVDIARGAFDDAEARAREALAIDPGDAETHAVLGDVLEAQGRLRDAAAAYARAVELDPRPAWRSRAATLRSAADLATLPAEYRSLSTAASVTRGQLAALLGIRLESLLARAPRRVTVVLTDVRRHWAAPWILPVTRAGLMEAMPNHTFQPGTVVRRADLAVVIWRALQLAAADRPAEVNRWRAARAVPSDVPPTHLAHGAVAAVLAAGAMSAAEDGQFRPSQVVSGAEALAAVARVEQVAGGRR